MKPFPPIKRIRIPLDEKGGPTYAIYCVGWGLQHRPTVRAVGGAGALARRARLSFCISRYGRANVSKHDDAGTNEPRYYLPAIRLDIPKSKPSGSQQPPICPPLPLTFRMKHHPFV